LTSRAVAFSTAVGEFNMRVRMLATLSVLACLSLAGQSCAGQDDAPPAPDAPKPEAGAKEKKGKGGGHAAGLGGIFKAIADHAADLNLTDEQKDKLQKLKSDTEAAAEKIKGDTEIANIQAQIKEARQAGDKDKTKALHKELRDAMDKKGGDPLLAATKSAEAILTPEQQAKLKDFQKPAHGGKKAADKKPDAAGEKKEAAEKPGDKAAETAAKPDAPAPADNGMGMDK
jgi:Spy/CpxP family protein refolding chaperone